MRVVNEIMNSNIRFNNSYEMDTKIKDGDPLSEDVVSQNETKLFHQIVKMKRNNDTVVLGDDCDMVIKTEIKSETPFTEQFVKQIMFETVTCSNNWEINMKTEMEEQTLVSDFGTQNEEGCLPEDPVVKNKMYNCGHEMDNKIKIKEEPSWLEIEMPSVHNQIKDGNFPPVKSSRLFAEAASGASSNNSPLPSAEVLGRQTSFYNGKHHLEHECQKIDVTNMPTAEEHDFSERSGKYSERGKKYISPLYSNKKSLIHRGEKPHKCNICAKDFRYLSQLKTHILIHEGKKPHQCETCNKSFTDPSSLKRHYFTHQGKKPHQCKTCHKSFTDPSSLKRHYFIHEGKKPHQCKTCDKSFTQLAQFKRHSLIHEGKKPYQCETCDKSFIQLGEFKRHSMIHEGAKPHWCSTCGKSFTQVSNLKRHNFIHEGKKPYQCKTCGKSFTRLGDLKTHDLIHQGKKPHQCETCDLSFTDLSNFKRHKLIHEGKKPHQCKICNKSFARLGDLKTHNFIHEDKKPHQCESCDKSFSLLSHLKQHNLIHGDK